MYNFSEQEIEELVSEESRSVPLSGGSYREVTATRQHWLVLEECREYGWTTEQIADLTLQESKETGRDFGECFLYLLAYIQADGRHTVGLPEGVSENLPLLPNDYQPREKV